MVLFLLVQCLLLLPLVIRDSVIGPYLVSTLCPSFKCCNHLDGEERAGCSNLIVFLISRDCKCSVALPHGAMGWSTCVIVVFPDHTHLLF